MSAELTNTNPAPSEGGKVARRALLAAAGVGVCAAGVAATPYIAGEINKLSKDAANAAYEAGLNAGRQALLAELAQLEGVTLDTAINVAELLKTVANTIALPVTKLVSGVGVAALQVIADGLTNAQSLLAKVGQHVDQLDQMRTLVITWQTNLAIAPTLLNDVANKDISGAESYLKALRAKIEGAAKTPTATK